MCGKWEILTAPPKSTQKIALLADRAFKNSTLRVSFDGKDLIPKSRAGFWSGCRARPVMELKSESKLEEEPPVASPFIVRSFAVSSALAFFTPPSLFLSKV